MPGFHQELILFSHYTAVDIVHYVTDICNSVLYLCFYNICVFSLVLNKFIFLDLLKMSFNDSDTPSQSKQIV